MTKQYFYLFCFFISFTQTICIGSEIVSKNFSDLDLDLKKEIARHAPNIKTYVSFLRTCKELADPSFIRDIWMDKKVTLLPYQHTKALVNYAQRTYHHLKIGDFMSAKNTITIFSNILLNEDQFNKKLRKTMLTNLGHRYDSNIKYNIIAYNGIGIDKKNYLYKSITEKKASALLVLLLNTPQDALVTGHFQYFSPIVFAVKHKSHKCLQLLLQHANHLINQQDAVGNTALHYACENNDIDATKLLIKYGCDLNRKNIYQETAFYIANNQQKQLLLNAAAKQASNTFKRKNTDSGHDNTGESVAKKSRR